MTTWNKMKKIRKIIEETVLHTLPMATMLGVLVSPLQWNKRPSQHHQHQALSFWRSTDSKTSRLPENWSIKYENSHKGNSKYSLWEKTQVLSNILDEDLIDIFTTFHTQNTEEYTFFSSAHGTVNLRKLKSLSSIFSDTTLRD